MAAKLMRRAIKIAVLVSIRIEYSLFRTIYFLLQVKHNLTLRTNHFISTLTK